jgi:hypothetical protein
MARLFEAFSDKELRGDPERFSAKFVHRIVISSLLLGLIGTALSGYGIFRTVAPNTPSCSNATTLERVSHACFPAKPTYRDRIRLVIFNGVSLVMAISLLVGGALIRASVADVKNSLHSTAKCKVAVAVVCLLVKAGVSLYRVITDSAVDVLGIVLVGLKLLVVALVFTWWQVIVIAMQKTATDYNPLPGAAVAETGIR